MNVDYTIEHGARGSSGLALVKPKIRENQTNPRHLCSIEFTAVKSEVRILEG